MLAILSPVSTERLVLRPFTPDVLDDLYAIQPRSQRSKECSVPPAM